MLFGNISSSEATIRFKGKCPAPSRGFACRTPSRGIRLPYFRKVFEILPDAKLPHFLLLTVAERPLDGEILLDVDGDTEAAEKAAAGLDGLYVQYQRSMRETPAGSAALRLAPLSACA